MKFWLEVDGALLRESVKLADPVRQAIEMSVDIDEIIRQWRLAYPADAEITKDEARAWANVNIPVDNRELAKGLGMLYAVGWLFGKDVATSAYAHAKLNKAAPTDEQLNALLNVDWANWVPGRNPGALLAQPPGGLAQLLQNRGLDLQGLTSTLLNRIGTQLADALAKGSTDEQLARAIGTVVKDPERALTIANTSMASAMSVSTRETYQEFGLAKMRWVSLDPCNTCQSNSAVGPVTPGEAAFTNVQGFPITEPAAHPNCRCTLAPVIDLEQFKFSSTQARDDHGRWTSGANGGYVAGKDLTSKIKAMQADPNSSLNKHIAASNSKGVPGPLEVARALSRLTILPNPIDPTLDKPEKFVESPWQTVASPTVDPNVWDDAQIEVVTLKDLLGTDIFLRRKKIASHIERMGGAETPFRNYALIVNDGGAYKIIDGHHRLFAQWLLGQDEAPAWVATV